MHVTHYLLGDSFDAPCGIYSVWHRGLAGTRHRDKVSCKRCLAWLKKENR